MGIPHDTVLQLRNEGITTIEDLADFDKDSLQQLADNLRRPGGRVPDPNPGAALGSTIPTPPFVFGAKSQKRLLVACDLVRYYQTTGRDISAANMRWTHVMKNFEIQWKALKEMRDDDEPEVPKITKALPIIKWTEAFQDFLNRVVGARTIPLSYVIRENVAVPAVAPPLATNRPHSDEHGSVERELVARASHNHPLFRNDDASVYYHIEEATRGTTYAASLKPYQRGKQGGLAWIAIKSQYAGEDKWEGEIKKQEALLHSRKWRGQSNFSLEAFIAQHRNAFVSMQACAEHIPYQLPNEHSRVGYLLSGIQTTDAGLQAAMASVETDSGPTGKRNNFESCASHLVKYDPVAKRRRDQAGHKRGSAEISGVEEEREIGATASGPKAGIGKTGVHLRYHTSAEYKDLTTAQKDELREWRSEDPASRSGPKKKKRKKNNQAMGKKAIAAVVAKQVAAQLKASTEQKEEEKNDEDLLCSMVDAAVKLQLGNTATAAAATASNSNSPSTPRRKVTLKSILRNAQNKTT